MRSRFLLSLAAIALLAACKGGDNQQQSARTACPAGQLCLEAGNGAEPNSLDPHKTQGTWESRIVSDLMVGLTDNDAAGNVIPGMATSWETSADGLVWTFHLRQANWSDGQPVTSEDFVYALRRILTPATAAEYASLLYFIKGAEPVNGGKAAPETLGVRALGPQTLEITLEHPAPYILELAKHQTMYPVPKHVVEKWGDKWTDPAHYVSNGPYKLTYWKLGDKVTAVKNASYWGAEDRPSAERQVKRGELDMHSPIPPNRIPYLRKKDQLPDDVHSHTYLGVAYLPVNTSNPVMRDKRVRLALTMAIDREFIVKGILMDTGFEAAFNFVPPGVANYTSPPPPVWSTWPLERRQQEARRLLAEGWRIGAVDLEPSDLARAFGRQAARVELVAGDVSEEATATGAVMATLKRFGRIDGVVSNAGVMNRVPLKRHGFAEWRRVIDTNLSAAYLFARAAAVNLDRKQVVLSVLLTLQSAARA